MRYPTDLTCVFSDEHGNQRESQKNHEFSMHDHDQWSLTPSILDTNSFAFSHFASHESTDFSANSNAMATMFHSRAGDLHTPGFGFQLGTPLTASGDNNPTAIDPHGLQGNMLQQHAFHANSDMHLQQSFAPGAFLHQDSGYETIGPSKTVTPGQGADAAVGCLTQPSFSQHEYGYNNGTPREPASEEQYVNLRSLEKPEDSPLIPLRRLRYHVTLNAATAMVKQSTEIPVTYLNKGQAYALSLHDTLGSGPSPGLLKYRTTVRISFEDAEQRQRPAACWQLWKEGRGTAEAHQRGGKLQAVEFVEQNQAADSDGKRPRVDIDMASFDSFAVTWFFHS